MKTVENQKFDGERAFYGEKDLLLKNCSFDGPQDGESALKECRQIQVEEGFFNLRYPFWHDSGVKISGSEMTPLCRAALWYSDHLDISKSSLLGIKALRECSMVRLEECTISSAEFGWSVRDCIMKKCTAESEYFFLRGENLQLSNVRFQGKYSFQYTRNVVIEKAELNTKDAFWHAQNVTVRDSVVRGEYLAWYSENLTFINCRIIGTQPFCYCTGLRLIDCVMEDADLCFEKSDVEAVLKAPLISVKNPRSGTITVPEVGEIIMDDPTAQGVVRVTGKK